MNVKAYAHISTVVWLSGTTWLHQLTQNNWSTNVLSKRALKAGDDTSHVSRPSSHGWYDCVDQLQRLQKAAMFFSLLYVTFFSLKWVRKANAMNLSQIWKRNPADVFSCANGQYPSCIELPIYLIRSTHRALRYRDLRNIAETFRSEGIDGHIPKIFWRHFWSKSRGHSIMVPASPQSSFWKRHRLLCSLPGLRWKED